VKAESVFASLKKGMEEKERLCFLGLSHVEFIRPAEKRILLNMFGNPKEVFRLSLADLGRLLGRTMVTRLWDPTAILRSAERTEKFLTENGMGSIFYGDSTYPPQLREIYDPPLTLFYRGTLPDNGHPLAGIVGTRFPTGGARSAAFRLGSELGHAGVGVVSGLARGIDREAHDGCLHAGGRTVAVLGSGIDQIYPFSSRPSGMAILSSGGAILSEYPPGVPPLQYHFPARNRIISGLCRCVVVVQAPEKSGALITAEHALQEGRDLYVHRAGLAGSAGAGTRRLADAGDVVIQGGADILREWGIPPGLPAASSLPEDLPHGERLARLLEEEISGTRAAKSGSPHWRE
jgi:DNA processing protein